jgi:hypothetical protein
MAVNGDGHRLPGGIGSTMRIRSLAFLAVAALAMTHAPANAAVDDAGPGLICQFASTTDPTAEPGTQSGELSGGPLVLQDSTTNLPGSGTLTCRVQTNQPTHVGSGPSIAGHGTGVVTAGPATINYTAGGDDDVYLCAEFTDDTPPGTTYYWNGDVGGWGTDPNVPCGHASGGGDGVAPSVVTITAAQAGDTPTFTPPPGFACTGGGDGTQYVVTCEPVVAANEAVSNLCDEVEADVYVGGVGTVSATSECLSLAASVSVTGPIGSGTSIADGTSAMPWKCTVTVSGLAAPWHAECYVWYH